MEIAKKTFKYSRNVKAHKPLENLFKFDSTGHVDNNLIAGVNAGLPIPRLLQFGCVTCFNQDLI